MRAGHERRIKYSILFVLPVLIFAHPGIKIDDAVHPEYSQEKVRGLNDRHIHFLTGAGVSMSQGAEVLDGSGYHWSMGSVEIKVSQRLRVGIEASLGLTEFHVPGKVLPNSTITNFRGEGDDDGRLIDDTYFIDAVVLSGQGYARLGGYCSIMPHMDYPNFGLIIGSGWNFLGPVYKLFWGFDAWEPSGSNHRLYRTMSDYGNIYFRSGIFYEFPFTSWLAIRMESFGNYEPGIVDQLYFTPLVISLHFGML